VKGILRHPWLTSGRSRAPYTSATTSSYDLTPPPFCRASGDFLEGPECLRDGGVRAAAAVHELRAEYPETRLWLVSEVPGMGGTALPPIAPLPPAPSRERS